MQRRNSLIAGRYTTSSADGRRRDLCRMNLQLRLCDMPSSQTEALHWMNFISCFCYILSAQPTWSRQHRQQCNINRKLSSLRSLLRFASMRRAHYKVWTVGELSSVFRTVGKGTLALMTIFMTVAEAAATLHLNAIPLGRMTGLREITYFHSVNMRERERERSKQTTCCPSNR